VRAVRVHAQDSDAGLELATEIEVLAGGALRVRQIINRYSPELADRAAYHSSELELSTAPDPAAGRGDS